MSIKAKHTPGPWSVRFSSDGEDCFVEAPKTNPGIPYNIDILSEDHWGEDYPFEQYQADCQLVSASPDLYEICKKLSVERNFIVHVPDALRDELQEAISKAEGL